VTPAITDQLQIIDSYRVTEPGEDVEMVGGQSEVQKRVKNTAANCRTCRL